MGRVVAGTGGQADAVIDSVNKQKARSRARRAQQTAEATAPDAKPRLRVVASVATTRPPIVNDEFNADDVFVGVSAYAEDDAPPFDPPDAEDLLALSEDDDDGAEPPRGLAETPEIEFEEEREFAEQEEELELVTAVEPVSECPADVEEPLILEIIEDEAQEAVLDQAEAEDDDVPFDPPDEEEAATFVRAAVLDDLLPPPPQTAPVAANENREPHPIAKFVRAAEPNYGVAPPVSIHISWDRAETGNVAASMSDDPRMSRAEITSERGGLDGAVVKFASQTPPDLLIVDTTLGGQAMFKALARLRAVLKPETKVVVVGAVNDVRLFRELAARGVDEYVVAPVQPLQLVTTACALFAETDSSRVIAVIGARGGVGASAIARNLAWSIAEQHQIPAALVDLDLSFGTAAFDVHVETPRSVAELLAEGEDDALPERVSARCTERLRILRAPADLREEGAPDPEAVERMVRAVRRLSPFVILDLPHAWNAWVKQALASADDVILVASPDLASMRNGEAMLRLLKADRGDRAEPLVALSMVGVPKRPEITFKDFAETLKSTPVASFAFDPELFGLAALKGQMVGEIAPKSKAAESITKLSSLLTGHEPPKHKKKDLRAVLVDAPKSAAQAPEAEGGEALPADDQAPLELIEPAPPVAEYILRARQAAEAEILAPVRQREEPRRDYKPPIHLLKAAACVLAFAAGVAWYKGPDNAPPQATAQITTATDTDPTIVVVAQRARATPARYEAALSLLQADNAAEAVPLLRELADENYAPAQYRLAKAYERGEGVALDLEAARRWTERAASHGNVRAMHDLGVYYAMGHGAPVDEATAFRWFRQAAEYGVADSQYNLGLLYQQGRGVTESVDEALFWFGLAARQGDEAARERVAALEETVTDVQRDQAYARAQAFAVRTPDPRANAAPQVMQAESASEPADAPT